MNSDVIRISALLLLAACADFSRGPEADAALDGAPAGSLSDGGSSSDGGGGFAARAAPILASNCQRCHNAGGQASASRLVLTGDAARDRATVLALISTSNPAGSPLLIEATGQGHGGGAILRSDGADYRTLLDWVSQGGKP